jgi:glucose/arabinose dehydrogenase
MRIRSLAIPLAAACLGAATLGATPAAAKLFDSSAGFIEATRVAAGFENPWSLAFLPDGRLLVTERPGRLRLVRDGEVSPPIAGVPEVYARGQGGLFDVVLAPDFADSGTLFLAYAEPRGDGAATALARARLVGDRLENVTVIFRMNRPSQGGRHFGGRIVFAPDGTLFLTTGDRGEPDRAQDPFDHAGKVLRLNPDGSIPADNPFADGAAAAPEVWSLGHRNIQGAGFDAEGRLWTVEHGAAGGDEVNRPEPGRNYGWPVISYGREYSGGRIGEGAAKPGMEQPAFHWDPSIAPSGLTVYDGALFPQWRGNVLVGALKFQLIARLEPNTDDRFVEERIFDGDFGRIRDLRTGPDGALWFLTDEDPGAIYRLAPAD